MKHLVRVALFGLIASTSFAALQCGNGWSSQAGSSSDVEGVAQGVQSFHDDQIQLSNGAWASSSKVAMIAEGLKRLAQNNYGSYLLLCQYVWGQGIYSSSQCDLTYRSHLSYWAHHNILPGTNREQALLILKAFIVRDASGNYSQRNPLPETDREGEGPQVVSQLLEDDQV